ncbi:MAG: S8 family serine peptidase [Isosphaeraceae bacterium]
MDWSADLGAKIVSMSLGSERLPGQPFAAVYERVAQRLLASGILIVAAAGNGINRPFARAAVDNPAACPSIMAAASVDRHRRIAPFSCAQLHGIGTLDGAGPGVVGYSSWSGGRFRTCSGTNTAAPHLAGIAALYRQRHPDLSA